MSYEAGEDKTDPLIVHVRALHRFLKAVLEEFGQTVWLAALKDAGIYGRSWFGPHHWTDGNPCPCRSCTPRRPPPRRRKSSSQVT